MRAESGPSPSDFGNLQRGTIQYFPVVPGKLEFAAALRRKLLAERPQVVAVELPATLEAAYLSAVARMPAMSVILYADQSDEDTAIYVPVEPSDPFVEALRTAREIKASVVFLDPDSGERPHIMDRYPDSYALQSVSIEKFVELYRLFPQERTPEIERHADGIAWKLQGSDPLARTLVVISLNLLDPVLDAMERPQSPPARRRRSGVQVLNPHPASLAEITTDYPRQQERYLDARRGLAGEAFNDRLQTQVFVLREAEKLYEKNAGEKVAHWQRRAMARYSRNLAILSHLLAPTLFDLATAARSVVDDNYAWEVWETGGAYRHQKENAEVPTAFISGEEVWVDTKKMRLRRRLPSEKHKLRPVGLKKRLKEKIPGEWAKELDGDSICSYPPEDLVIEGFGQFLKKKGKSILSEERSRVEPFTTSLLDGIDLRETIRNWHEGRIYVREAHKIHGEVGSVIVIFDEDREGKYEYMTTWLGEHQNESDMAFYSTFPFANLIGPGIGRGEYGGFLMSLPARRMHNVWFDPDYDFAENKPERLLMAGIDYSLQKYVVYVAAKPPRSVFRNMAARMGRTIIYIPIGQLSPLTLKKIRVVHVLDGHDKRRIAKQYLW